MAFFKKKEDKFSELPELPGMPMLPELPPLPDEKPRSSISPLPSFPKTESGDSMNLGAIKSSVTESPMQKSREFEIRKIDLGEKRSFEMPAQAIQKTSASMRSEMMAREQPVFVKLEKFQDAVKKFEEIKSKVEDIEDALKKIRELKDREETELKSWETEVQAIKEKVSVIDNSLFSRL